MRFLLLEDQQALRVTSVVVLAILLVGTIFTMDWLTYTGITLLGLALVSSTINEYFAWIWMKFARAIGTVNSKILLTLIFYLFLTPIALLYRLIMGNPLITVDREGNRNSYFSSRDKTFDQNDFETPW